MKKNIYKCAYATAFVIIIAIFVLTGTAYANNPEIEVFDSDVFKAPAPPEPDSGSGTPHSVYEEPQVADEPIWIDMFEQWEREGYPDDIGGRFFDSYTGSVGILVVDPTPQRIAELREMFGSDVIITPSKYSHNELRRVHSEISEMMFSNPDSGIYGVGIGWTRTDGVVHGFGESGKEFRVVVQVDESAFDHYSIGFMNRYSDRVFIEAVSPESFRLFSVDDSEDGTAVTIDNNIVPIEITGVFSGNTGIGGNIFGAGSVRLWFIISIALFGIILLFVWLRLRPTPAKQTANSGIVAGKTAFTKKQVVAAVKSSDSVPSDELFKTILQRIDGHR